MKFYIILFISIFSVILGNLQEKCNFEGNVLAVDSKANSNTYDVLLSLSTAKDCKFTCQVNQNGKHVPIVPKETNKYSFKLLYYTFLTISGLKQGEKYTYSCTNEEKEFPLHYPKFTSEKLTKFIAVGDWSDTKEGISTLEYLTKKNKRL